MPVSESELAAGLSEQPEDELLRVELEEAQKKKRKGWTRWLMIAFSVATIGLTFAFVLPHIADYQEVWELVKGLSWAWIVGLAVAAADQCRDVRSAVDGGAAGAVVLPLEPGHARVDGGLGRRSGWGSGRDGRVVRDAEVVGLRGPSGRARGDGDEHLEPAHDPRCPDCRRRAVGGRRRPQPHARVGGADLARGLLRNRGRLRGRPRQCASDPPDRRQSRAGDESGEGVDSQSAGHLERRGVRALPRRSRSC